MNIEEVSKLLNVSISSLETNFPKTKLKMEKKGIILNKEGSRGPQHKYIREKYFSNQYFQEILNEIDSTIPENQKEVFMSEETLNLAEFEFYIFLAIVLTPMMVFRGSYTDFLKYMDVPHPGSKKNKELLIKALESLAEQKVIMYNVDDSAGEDDVYFVATILRKAEKDMELGIGMVQECKRLQEQYHKRSMIPLLKVWLGVQVLSNRQPYTMNDLVKLTGLSAYSVRESNKILQETRAITIDGLAFTNSRMVYMYPSNLGDLTSIKDANNFEVLNSFTKLSSKLNKLTYNIYVMTDTASLTNGTLIFK